MTIVINLGLHTGCIGSIFITGIFGNFYTKQGGDFWLSEREFPVALVDGQNIDAVSEFTYLVQKFISNDNSMTMSPVGCADLQCDERPGSCHDVWKEQNLNLTTRLRVYTRYVRFQCWTITLTLILTLITNPNPMKYKKAGLSQGNRGIRQ